ncbi:hypothetical protein DYBT9275_05236 [Dyadobacter sp. CECT 9275]|uniref:Beta-lactamase-inhibitor-like PepSY-like domain-containing protein n=2 Tax=Dyadobacter helix TaxID=2822344 RepID=A0A916N753_9BACT|nr:hypothetical protein DYBT9275_05236 [Dyadobacter sp. CECT 9275]
MLAFILVACAAGGSFAQTATLVITKVDKATVPLNIRTAADKDFPGGEKLNFGTVPAKLYADGYRITYNENNLDGAKPEFYYLTISGKGYKGDAVYDKNGNLIHYKEKIANEILPLAVIDAIKIKYPDAVLMKDSESIKKGLRSKVETYHVSFKNKGKKGFAIVDVNGRILHSRA